MGCCEEMKTKDVDKIQELERRIRTCPKEHDEVIEQLLRETKAELKGFKAGQDAEKKRIEESIDKFKCWGGSGKDRLINVRELKQQLRGEEMSEDEKAWKYIEEEKA
jgi:hypothetical protein